MNDPLPLASQNKRLQPARETSKRILLSAALLTAGLSLGLAACQDSHSSKPEPIIVDPPIPDQWDAMFWDIGFWQD
ncbi:MAG: hypothetical protein ACYTG5_22100 [Planctomycetota bacterium]|jgi:hypothetical protein